LGIHPNIQDFVVVARNVEVGGLILCKIPTERLQAKKEYFEKIFVISHNPLISNWANSVVRITKVDNISKVSQ
jgi:hypothetical protein